MDFGKLTELYEAKKSSIPEGLKDREEIKAANVRSAFTNDAPIVIIRKPKNENKSTGKWKRVCSKDGTPIFQMVAYIPILYNGKKCLVITSVWESIAPLLGLWEEEELEHGKLIKGASHDDVNRWERFDASELIEGSLCFTFVDKEYKDGKTHPVAVLSSAE